MNKLSPMVLVVAVVVGCGGVAAVEPDAGGAAGSSAAGSSGAAAGSSGAGAAGWTGAAGTGSAGAAAGSGGAGTAAAGTSGGAGAGAAGASGTTGAAGRGYVNGKPWCLTDRPSDWVPVCEDLDLSRADFLKTTGMLCGSAAAPKFKEIPVLGKVQCFRCSRGKNCATAWTSVDYTWEGTVYSCSEYTAVCVADCSECS